MTITSRHWRIRQKDFHELEANMSYIVSSNAAWAIEGINKQKEHKTKKNK